MSTTMESTKPILANVLAWPEHLCSSWRRRVGESTRSGRDLLAAEVRAFAELSPSDEPWLCLVASWPINRQVRFARLALELSEAGIRDEQGRAFLEIVAEADDPGIPPLDPAGTPTPSWDRALEFVGFS